MNYDTSAQNMEIPGNFVRVTAETFNQVSDHVSSLRTLHYNVISYKFLRNSINHQWYGYEIFGYFENSTNQFYLKGEILEQLNSGTWDSKAV
jgi:hypothetical protein